MKIGIYSPYLPKHAGGGEKHMLTSAWYLAQNHEVEILIPNDVPEAVLRDQILLYQRIFDIDLSQVQWRRSSLASRKGNPLTRWQETRKYDVFLYATDGSLFFTGAKRNILHIQIPFTNSQNGWFARQKLQSWNVRNANSLFTQKIVEHAWKVSIPFVHYPYVNTTAIPVPDLRKKKHSIIAVGRFFDPAHTDVHAKRQDVLLEAFLTGYEKYGWKKRSVSLTLVGGIDPGDVHMEFVKRLKQRAKGYPIRFHHDISYAQLHRLYDESLLFWHAAGFGIDENTQPQKVEHFGMSTIEAMAHACIPVVPNKGGLKETVDHEESGYRYETIDELEAYTDAVLNLGSKKRLELQQAARIKSETFSLERFCRTLDRMLEVS